MFSQASEYALRALTELARCEPEKWVLTGELAELLELPVHYLGKVLQNLARKGILESQRGRQGGFRLAAAAEEITVFDVVRELDDVRALETCVMGEASCSDETACPLHSLWKGIRDRFVKSLQSTTLKDLAAFQEQRPGSGRLSAVHPRLPQFRPAKPRRGSQGT
ncbi:MAG: Rrf2 family transcriptional regulator [Planctomycetes bacterium]|nr:Rrf2 family transcriptional regulator [Planctomycetota bacterium]